MLFTAAAAAVALASQPAEAALLGPTPYLSAADSPFNPASFSAFYLEDFEDSSINTPGVSFSTSCISNNPGCFPGGLIDSVGNGGDQTVGHSLFAQGTITITFDAAALGGSLPTAAGLVWTDGNNRIVFEALDQNGISLGTLIGDHAGPGFTGETDEDRFYGVTHAGGISRLVISNPPGIEIDHVQYGIASAIPEPASWGLMIGGLALVGSAMRRRAQPIAFA